VVVSQPEETKLDPQLTVRQNKIVPRNSLSMYALKLPASSSSPWIHRILCSWESLEFTVLENLLFIMLENLLFTVPENLELLCPFKLSLLR
jgi:hypothetical protein